LRKKVRHLALHSTIGIHYQHSHPSDESFLCSILYYFCNLETLALVNKYHSEEESEELGYMERTDLVMWKDRGIFWGLLGCEV